MRLVCLVCVVHIIYGIGWSRAARIYERNQYAEFSNAREVRNRELPFTTRPTVILYLVEVGRSCVETTVISN